MSNQNRQPALNDEADSVLAHMRSNGKIRHHREMMSILEAYDSGDKQFLRQRVQQLVDEDFDKALDVFARLDYTFLQFGMKFPHDIVVTYLEEHHSEEESMELLAAYCKNSSITTSIMSLYFNQWFDRDHIGQFNWFKTNSTFNQPVTVLKYSEKIGNSEKGLEVLRLIDDLPQEDTRREAVYTGSMEYMSSDKPALLGEYLGELDTIPDNAYSPIYNMTERIVRNELDTPVKAMERAAEWIDLIKDETLHIKYLATTASHLGIENPDAYQQWLDSYQFKDEQSRRTFLAIYDEEIAFLKDVQHHTVDQIESSTPERELSE